MGNSGCRKPATDDRTDQPLVGPSPRAVADSGQLADGGAPPIRPLPDSFDELYPLFLMRKLGPGDKTALWSRYQGRWVRWTGKLIKVGTNGAQFKHYPPTVTFDVSVTFDEAARGRLSHYRPGDVVKYIGRLESYDDVLKTFYLSHGDVPPRPVDAGAPDAAP